MVKPIIKTSITAIIKAIAIWGTLLLAASAALAQEKQTEGAAKPMPMQHEHHGFMQEGMHHAVAKGVKLDPNFDMATHTITLRVGPMNLPAHTSHMKMPQPPDLIWTVPLDGWLLAYHPKLVDAGGNSVPGTVLHHVAFWNENRADFLCPNKEEHIFGAGSELTDWTEVPGYGYHVQKDDRIRIETMVYNPTATSYEKVYLEVVISLQDAAESLPPRKNVYPAWMDVKSCGNSSYDVPAGKSEKSGNVIVKYDGVLLVVGGHLHDYGRQIVLEDLTRKETAATLDAKVDEKGRLEAVPVKLFVEEGGFKLSAGDVLKTSATYDNPTAKLLRSGAMRSE